MSSGFVWYVFGCAGWVLMLLYTAIKMLPQPVKLQGVQNARNHKEKVAFKSKRLPCITSNKHGERERESRSQRRGYDGISNAGPCLKKPESPPCASLFFFCPRFFLTLFTFSARVPLWRWGVSLSRTTPVFNRRSALCSV